ncbi:MAG: fibronectin type III domain-containing protein, partial [Acidimicrobiaceae bacterium]|nr:fibronectin type III domain-containing protein [Acidimicrobiaceae bacterium]
PCQGPTSLATFVYNPHKITWNEVLGSRARDVRLHQDARDYTITGLANGSVYHVSVSAYNSSGYSAAISGTAVPRVAAPSAPTGLVLTPDDGEIQVSWQPASHSIAASVEGYDITWSDSGGPIYSASVRRGTTAYTIGGLVNGRAYSVKVYAYNINDLNRVTYSAAISGTATPVVVPSAPTGLVLTPADGQIQVSWQPAPQHRTRRGVQHTLVYRHRRRPNTQRSRAARLHNIHNQGPYKREGLPRPRERGQRRRQIGVHLGQSNSQGNHHNHDDNHHHHHNHDGAAADDHYYDTAAADDHDGARGAEAPILRLQQVLHKGRTRDDHLSGVPSVGVLGASPVVCSSVRTVTPQPRASRRSRPSLSRVDCLGVRKAEPMLIDDSPMTQTSAQEHTPANRLVSANPRRAVRMTI